MQEARCRRLVVVKIVNVLVLLSMLSSFALDLTGCWKSHPYRGIALSPSPPTTPPFLFKGFANTAVEIARDGTEPTLFVACASCAFPPGGAAARGEERRPVEKERRKRKSRISESPHIGLQ